MPKLTFNSQILATVKHAKAIAASVNAVYNAIRSWTTSSLTVDSLKKKSINSMHYAQPPSKLLVGSCANTASIAAGDPLCSVLYDPTGTDPNAKIVLFGFIWVHETIGSATYAFGGDNQQIDVKIGGVWQEQSYYFGGWDAYAHWNPQQRQQHGYDVIIPLWNAGGGGGDGPIPDSVCSGTAGARLQFGGAQCSVLTRVYNVGAGLATATEWGVHGSTAGGAGTMRGTAKLFAIIEDSGD